MVEIQSAPFRKLVTSVVPSAREPSMTARWEMDLSPGTVISPQRGADFVNFIMQPFLTFIDDVTVFPEKLRRFFQGRFFIKFHMKNRFLKFTVVDDTDVFDADAVGGEDGGQSGDSSGFIHHIAVEGIAFRREPWEESEIEFR